MDKKQIFMLNKMEEIQKYHQRNYLKITMERMIAMTRAMTNKKMERI
jgi:hypothetical protein